MANEKHARSSLQASVEVGAAFLKAGTDEIVRFQAENERLREALGRMLDEFAASLNSGKAVGYSAGSMQRALRVIREAEELLPEWRR